MIYMGLGAATVSLLFHACYGMPPNEADTISGVVRSKTEEPVPGIKVSIKDVPSDDTFTNENGYFYIYVPQQESYKLKFEDVDGDKNGSFKTLKKKISMTDIHKSLKIYLEEADAE
jgi:putative lipoprotein (rSAM/lipoprotein system)